MSLILETLCLLSCRGLTAQVCTLDCTKLCTSCKGCSECCSPNPYNCKYFYYCEAGEYSIKQCPTNTGYNPETFSCELDFPCYLSECQSLCSTLSCKEDCCAPNDCDSYFKCTSGNRSLKFCNGGHFNPSTLKCDKEYNCSHANMMDNRNVLSKDEFLDALYSVYTKIEEAFRIVN